MSEPRKDTRVHLVREIVKLLESGDIEETPLISQIIFEAIAGEFHDYKNKKYTCGKVALYSYLMKAGLVNLALRVQDGEFDEVPDEEDKAEMRRTTPRNMWKALGLE